MILYGSVQYYYLVSCILESWDNPREAHCLEQSEHGTVLAMRRLLRAACEAAKQSRFVEGRWGAGEVVCDWFVAWLPLPSKNGQNGLCVQIEIKFQKRAQETGETTHIRKASPEGFLKGRWKVLTVSHSRSSVTHFPCQFLGKKWMLNETFCRNLGGCVPATSDLFTLQANQCTKQNTWVSGPCSLDQWTPNSL